MLPFQGPLAAHCDRERVAGTLYCELLELQAELGAWCSLEQIGFHRKRKWGGWEALSIWSTSS